MDTWEKIIQLEELFAKAESKGMLAPGTIIQRTVDGWSLAFGKMLLPKSIFYGETIEDCILQANNFLLNLL